MLNREIYKLDPLESKLANNGVAEVKDDLSKGALETLDYELRTFVCSGAYAKGMADILSNYLRNVKSSGEQPAVWISGFFGSGKSHLAKMLRTLWVNQKMESGADARSLVELPDDVRQYFDELSTLGSRLGGSMLRQERWALGQKTKFDWPCWRLYLNQQGYLSNTILLNLSFG